MKDTNNYCPDCSSEMEEEVKVLGFVKHWLTCVGCGLREEDLSKRLIPIREIKDVRTENSFPESNEYYTAWLFEQGRVI